MARDFETILYEVDDNHVATITLNRPEALNAFNLLMRAEFKELWNEIKFDDNVHTVLLKGAGERAFSVGIDVWERAGNIEAGTDKSSYSNNPFNSADPGFSLGPKSNDLWKPIICAVHGLAAGGAQYWINEADITICSPDAQFFDPHVTFGMTTALEPIGMRWKAPLGEVLRWALMGNDERMTAERALQIGMVSEIVPRDELFDHAYEIARTIAAKPSIATQGTVKAIWQSLDLGRNPGLNMGLAYVQLGNPIGEQQVDRKSVPKVKPRLR
ncbi:MAG: enoyl-CoA hydratase/isomerase family protein [Acidobacteria bacterium]|nr:enoyl-CoA hydratase/isomerase family protein [Acidobacteriota bacterium]